MKLFKSLIPREPRSGVTVTTYPAPLSLYGGSTISYNQLYRTSPAVHAVVDLLSSNISQIPLHIYQRSGADRESLPSRDHGVELLRRPNAQTSGSAFRRDVVADLALHGNSYAIKVRSADGAVGALVRVPPSTVALVQKDQTEAAAYRVMFNAGEKDFPAEDVVHFRMYSPDSLLGVSPLESLRSVLAEDEAAVQNREGFWRNAARQAGFLLRPLDAPDWSDEARERFRQEWNEHYTGAENAGTTVVLEDGITHAAAAFSPQESEYVAARQLTLQLVCSVYGVPQQLLNGTDRNVDAAMRSLTANTLAPWLTLVESTIDQQLVPDLYGGQAVNGRIFAEHTLEEKTRGSFIQQSEILSRAVGGAAYLTINEVRRLQNLPPLEGGDSLIEPLRPNSGDFVLNAHLPKGEAPVVNVAPANPEVNVVAARKQRKTRKTIERDKTTGAAVAVVEEEEH